MPRIRPPVRGFAPVAPGGGVSVGAGLQGVGQALESFSELRTNLELLDIQDQRQINRLEQAQFEKVERSSAIREHTTKQIWRNQTAERILTEAREARNYGDVQKQMDEAESDYDRNLFEGRTQQFIDTFGSIDSSARVGLINKLGTATQVGNLGLIRDDYQASAQNFADSVDALTTPEEINRFYNDLDENGVSMGFTEAWIEATSGEGRVEAMENYVRSLPLIAGLAALSDEEVAGTLGEERRERMLRDLNTKANILRAAQERFSAVHERVTGINLLDAFAFNGESASSIAARIRNDENISPTRKKDMLDLLDVIAAAREKGPQEVDPEVVRTNEVLADELIKALKARSKAIRENEEMSLEDKKKAVLELSDQAIAIYQDNLLKSEQGLFRSSELVGLAFDVRSISEGLFVEEEIVKSGFFARFVAGDIFSDPNKAALEGNFRAPTGIVSEMIDEMNAGKGRYGKLPSGDKASIGTLLIEASNQTPDFGRPIEVEKANALAQELFSVIDKRFLTEVKGVAPENVEQVGGLMFDRGPPATEPRQQTDITGVADSIRKSLNSGFTLGEIEEFMRTQQNFTQEVFDRAAATIQVAQ